MQSFVFNVMARFLSKLSRWFLYNVVSLNHLLNREEPLAKQKDARSRNGVVGRTGITTPMAPIPKNKKPSTMYMYFKVSSPFLI